MLQFGNKSMAPSDEILLTGLPAHKPVTAEGHTAARTRFYKPTEVPNTRVSTLRWMIQTLFNGERDDDGSLSAVNDASVQYLKLGHLSNHKS